MPRLRRNLRLVVPPCYVAGAVLRAVEQRILPKYDRINREPRNAVTVQTWDGTAQRWEDRPGLDPSDLRDGLPLCVHMRRGLGVGEEGHIPRRETPGGCGSFTAEKAIASRDSRCFPADVGLGIEPRIDLRGSRRSRLSTDRSEGPTEAGVPP